MATTTTRRPATLSLVADRVRPAIEQAVDDYLAAVHARGGSARTDEYYDAVLRKRFLPWVAAEKITGLDQLDQRHLDRLNAALLDEVNVHTGKPLSRASVNSYLRGIRMFLSWAKVAGRDYRLKVQGVKVGKKERTTLSRGQMNALENAAPTERDKLIIRLFADTGIRLTELLALTPESMIEGQGRDRQRRWLRVHGKGNRERLVPLMPAVFTRLRKYATQGRPADCGTDRIFISLRRRPQSGQYEALAARAVQQMLKAVSDRAGLDKANPHHLRHSNVTNSLRDGMNPVALASMLGHRDLSMINEVYAHLNPSDVYDQLAKVLVKD